MKGRRFLKGLLFPPAPVLFALLPIGTICLVLAMTHLEDTAPLRIAAYLQAFYTLVIWCARVPRLAAELRQLRFRNRYLRRWFDDPRLRTNISLTGSAVWNGAYAALQLGLGIYHGSVWFYSLAAYYGSLAGMRLYLLRHTLRHRAGEKMRQELRRYRACGWVFLLMNLALTGILLYRIREGRAVRHHEIVTIAMATYTFATLTKSIVNVVKYRKYHSPAFSASKAISLAAACVSLLTLESTMLATFGGAELPPQTQTLFLALSGGVISIFIITMALYMIIQSGRKLKETEKDTWKPLK